MLKCLMPILIFVMGLTSNAIGQNQTAFPAGENYKGQLYFYWGWNAGWFSKSDIHFKGSNYNFTLKDVVAYDRQSKFDPELYFDPATATIPQYNFRLGYFINKKYNISFGIDHMKYVAKPLQVVRIFGEINIDSDYDKVYDNDEIEFKDEFLLFEHTDGLNYINLEFRRMDLLYRFRKISVYHSEGIGSGFLYPRSNVTLLEMERSDVFHVAGYGISAMAGLQIRIGKHFFIQSELKGGFMHLPDVITTISGPDRAAHHFFFGQANFVLGSSFNLIKPKQVKPVNLD